MNNNTIRQLARDPEVKRMAVIGARYTLACMVKAVTAYSATWDVRREASAILATPKPEPKKKRVISPEGRAAIAAASKKRWAKYRKQQRKGA